MPGSRVSVLAPGGVPATQHVRGSNPCLIGAAAGRAFGRAILVSVKGASGQAVQKMNMMTGLHETLGPERPAVFP
ncbi:MAG: hypothetical protein L0210_13325 [Rhodospirillales bacterium]|nr:hypothetical protein [Rhodospirillales bacterium]